jgi:hypothetical protein
MTERDEHSIMIDPVTGIIARPGTVGACSSVNLTYSQTLNIQNSIQGYKARRNFKQHHSSPRTKEVRQITTHA